MSIPSQLWKTYTLPLMLASSVAMAFSGYAVLKYIYRHRTDHRRSHDMQTSYHALVDKHTQPPIVSTPTGTTRPSAMKSPSNSKPFISMDNGREGDALKHSSQLTPTMITDDDHDYTNSESSYSTYSPPRGSGAAEPASQRQRSSSEETDDRDESMTSSNDEDGVYAQRRSVAMSQQERESLNISLAKTPVQNAVSQNVRMLRKSISVKGDALNALQLNVKRPGAGETRKHLVNKPSHCTCVKCLCGFNNDDED